MNKSKKLVNSGFFNWIKKNVDVITLFAVTLFFIVLASSGVLNRLEFRLYDMMLAVRKEIKQDNSILFVEVDDAAIDQVGEWPWTRDVMGDTLLRMKELGASAAVFDIEYVSPSKMGVSSQAVENVNNAFAQGKEEITATVQEFSKAVSGGFISGKEINSVAGQMINDYISPSVDSMKAQVTNNMFFDYDDYFARCVQFFGNTWLTINAYDLEIPVSEEDKEYCYNRFLFKNIIDPKGLINKTNEFCAREKGNVRGFSPTLQSIIMRAKGAGFTNSYVDNDGSRRRIELLQDYEQGFIGQLVFAPVLDMTGYSSIQRKKNKLIIHDALIPGREKPCDIKIPLDNKGRMIINWLHKNFGNSFKHESIMFIKQLDEMESNIVTNLSYFLDLNIRDKNGVPLSFRNEAAELLDSYNQITQFKQYLLSKCEGYDIDGNPIGGGISEQEYSEYFEARQNFWICLNEFLNRGHEEKIINRLAELSEELNSREFEELGYSVNSLFQAISGDYKNYTEYFSDMLKNYQGSFCILGNTAAATTDMGVTPFFDRYPNVGTHANVVNTILQQNFITEVSWWWGILIVFFAALLVICLCRKMSAGKQTACGAIYLVVPFVVILLFMAIGGIYIPLLAPMLIAIFTFLAETLIDFANTNKDKKFIKNAFSQCLSPDVVDEIVADPSSLKLGGEKRDMTAIFTDIQKFSGFSELLTASELVALLNYYLTEMSDIIMEERGTVDKYEGDAIIALVGAPLKMEDHAKRACAAALKMKKAEYRMNREIEQIAASPKPDGMDDELYNAFCILVKNNRRIFTRIGINSGEMVAGFMGSENKKNYTMMGNNVNLASRLEGVNKQYSTHGILMSQATRDGLGDEFIVRSLDRVQVVNVNTPIRLYELLALREGASQKLIDYVEKWESTMKLFEAGEYKKALDGFKEMSKADPGDLVAKYYAKLIEDYFLKGKYPTEKDDAGVAFNPENPSGMNPDWIGTPFEIKGTFRLLSK